MVKEFVPYSVINLIILSKQSQLKTNTSQTTSNQTSSISTGQSNSSLSSSGISPALFHTMHLHTVRHNNQSKDVSPPANWQIQSSNKDSFRMRSASTSSSDDFVVVSPKLNRDKPKKFTTMASVNASINKLNGGTSIVRRHTLTFGTRATTTHSALFMSALKPSNINSTSEDIVKLVRSQQNICMRMMASKSASNLTSGIQGTDVNYVGVRTQVCSSKTPKLTCQNDKVVKKTILNLSPLSISASSVSSSSGAHSSETHPSNSNSSHSSLMSESRDRTTCMPPLSGSTVSKVLVTSLADEVGSVSKMSSTATTTTPKTIEINEVLINEPCSSVTSTSKNNTKYESFI